MSARGSASGCKVADAGSACDKRWSRHMSFLTKLPTELYSPDAFKEFIGGPAFDLGNAKAMAASMPIALNSSVW